MALVAQKHFLKYQEREGCVAFPLLEMYFAKRCPVSPPEFECFKVSGLCNFFSTFPRSLPETGSPSSDSLSCGRRLL